jgi:hypothetical protein
MNPGQIFFILLMVLNIGLSFIPASTLIVDQISAACGWTLALILYLEKFGKESQFM